MNGVSLSSGSPVASPGFTTALPIISSRNQGLQFSDHIPNVERTIQVKSPTTMGRRERKLRNYKRLLRRARRNRASEPCRMYAGVGSFLRIHTNGTVDGEFSKNPGELSIVQFIGLATAIGLVRIKGEVSKNYLCMNKNGILYGHPNMTDECVFQEHQEDNHYNYYSSHKYSKKKGDQRRGRRKKKGTKFWFVALNKNGTSRPAHRSRMDQMFTKFLLNRCKKIVVSKPDGPFDITKFTWPPPGGTFEGKIGGEVDTEKDIEEKETEREKKGKGKKKRCKGKRRGKKCGKGKKDKDKKEGDNDERDVKEKKDDKDRKKDKSKNQNETSCKRRWRNRKNRRDYVDEAKAVKRRRRCKERLRIQRLKDRQAKKEAKEAKKKAEEPATVSVEVKVVTTPKPVTTTSTTKTTSTTTAASTTTTTSVAESLPSATESDLKLQSNRFGAANGAATDFRSVFENLIKVIQINNKEMLSNFSSVNGGLASMLRLGRHNGQHGGSGPSVSGASLGMEHKHRHHHGEDGRRRHERALSDSQEGVETLSDSKSDLNMMVTQSSETGFKTDLVSDSMDAASKPLVTSRASPAKRAESTQFELFLKVLNELENQNGRNRPDGSSDNSDSDKFRAGVLIVGNGPRTPSWRHRLRRRHRNKSDSDTDAEHLDI